MFILNIHGYMGDSSNTNYNVLCNINNDIIVDSPQLDYNSQSPISIFNMLKNKIVLNNNFQKLIVGTSLGGFFAVCLGAELDIPVIVTNPCLLPFVYIPKLGDIPKQHEKQYADLFGKYIYNIDKRYVSTIIGLQDTIINHAYTKQVLKNSRYYEIDGEHSISDINMLDKLFKDIIFNYFENSKEDKYDCE